MLRSLMMAAFVFLAASARAGPAEDTCLADIAAMRGLAATMPADDLSRRFAERELETVVMEMDNGEVDECPAAIIRIRHIITTRPYRLLPGETFGRLLN